ncbi:hypothetical protein [Halomonas alimentaria]|uniref:hypothetical protein n=1 Tax=Halomonas alimentaria TaxID=147248 RepID=UPI002491E088|nr:hypothetical protein [Halomonas alimentaria]
MNFDFFSDLADELQRILLEAGLNVPTYEQLRSQDQRSEELKSKILHYDLSNLLLHFFTVFSRRLPVIPWHVHVSDRLLGRNEAIDIAKKLERGEDVNGLLSKRVKKLNQAKYSDLLRSEWDIYHFHLNENRSDELLFIYFSENNAYLIDILKHEKPDVSIITWTNTELFQILHDNWPHVIKAFILNNDCEAPVLTSEQRRSLRSKSVNASVVMSDGTEYMPMGGGFSPSKHPISAVAQSDFLYLTVKSLQADVGANYFAIEQALAEYTSTPRLKLKLDDDFHPVIVEVGNGILLNLRASNKTHNKLLHSE